jgi:hypothetical protein
MRVRGSYDGDERENDEPRRSPDSSSRGCCDLDDAFATSRGATDLRPRLLRRGWNEIRHVGGLIWQATYARGVRPLLVAV